MAYIENIPTIVVEDGKEYTLYATGDEFVHYLHDEEGNRIIQADDGKYYFAENDKDGNFVPSNVRVFKPTFNKSRLHRVKVKSKVAKIKDSEVDEIRKQFMEPMGGDYETKRRAKEAKLKNSNPENTEGDIEDFSSGPLSNPESGPIHLGQMNNLVVYIQFADDEGSFMYNSLSWDNRFNGPTNSVNHYFQTVSYGKAGITSHHFPPFEGGEVVPYTDIYNRGYYEPYNETSNPDGYTGGNFGAERRDREWALLRRAIEHIAPMVPTSIDLDKDLDGLVDSVSFIVKGSHGAWSSILWAHRWILGGTAVYINGKRVRDYCFQPESQSNRKILVHELFHVYGAPDLYRYSGGITPVASWDLMGTGGGHMGAWMKYKYTTNSWITEIPEITQSGYYTINSLHNNGINNCYKIYPSVESDEFYMVEYRVNNGDSYESLFGTGLLIYRINPDVNGNAQGPPDEVYIYRENGTLTVNGIISRAHHSQLVGRTAIGGEEPLKGFLKDGVDGGLDISDINDNGDGTITFYVSLPTPPEYKTLNLRSIPEGISVTGAGEYVPGQTVTISTPAHTGGNVFQHWTYDVPYQVPTVNTKDDYANIVYIDPSGVNGDGSMESPLNSFPTSTVPDTAYLLKRGTILEQSISQVFTSVLIGAYGIGAKPIIKTVGQSALIVQRYSDNVTIRNLHLSASGTSPYGNNVGGVGDGAEHRWQDTENITVAFCKVEGNTDGTGYYPRGGFGISGKNVKLFNNELSHCRSNFTGIQGEDLFIVRNWWHDTAKDSEPPNDTGTGDAIISQYMYNDLFNLYFAGNLIDVSNKTDKYGLMLNYTAGSERMNNFIYEYNTIYSNKEGRGGTGLRWAVGPNSIARKNLTCAIHPNGQQLVHNMSYWDYNSLFESPYGVRDNHFIQTEGRSVVGEGWEGNLMNENMRFGSWDEYNTYLSNNPEIGLYGSDINPDTFLDDSSPIFTTERIHEFTLEDDLSLIAQFEYQTRELTLELEHSGLAELTPSIGSNTYAYGTIVQITAKNIQTGYQFVHWRRPDGSIYSTYSATMISMQDDHHLTAVIEPTEAPDTFNVDVELILI